MQTVPAPSVVTRRGRRRRHDNGVVQTPSSRRRRRRGRRLAAAGLLVLAVPGWSFARAVLVSNGDPFAANATEWARNHGFGWLVDRTEHLWYSHHQPATGGVPRGGIPTVAPPTSTVATRPRSTAPARPLCPHSITPIATPALAGEGAWQPAGHADGAVCFTYLRGDQSHTAYLAGVAWMNMHRLRATLHNGTVLPGGGPWRAGSQIATADYARVEAAFNSGFRLDASRGGYVTEGRTVRSLVAGRASIAIYPDGHVDIGAWGRDINPSAPIASVRQNLDLLVDHAQVVPGLSNSSAAWGATLGNRVFTWRSGAGIDAHGNLLYVSGPALDVPTLAAVLRQAGAVRAMELDINPDWVSLMAYRFGGSPPSIAATKLLPSMQRPADRYLHSGTRDFIELDLKR